MKTTGHRSSFIERYQDELQWGDDLELATHEQKCEEICLTEAKKLKRKRVRELLTSWIERSSGEKKEELSVAISKKRKTASSSWWLEQVLD